MHPVLFSLTRELSVMSYGACLAIAFLTGTLLATRRAKRIGADPSVILQVTFLVVLSGVVGARLLCVIHYWDRYASQANPLLAAIDIRQGGLEFLGGFVAATLVVVVYFLIPRRVPSGGGVKRPLSLRLYLDILTPCVMWGLAITRIGCFLNGCCFGSPCVVAGTQDANSPWALRFPYGSPVFVRQWEEGKVSVPEELLRPSKPGQKPALLDRRALWDPVPKDIQGILDRHLDHLSQRASSRATSVAGLRALASTVRSLPVHPTQLYAAVNAMLLFGVLSALFYMRRRDGIVFVSLFLLYPISRFALESIRADNPHDTFGLTISQFISVVMFVAGVIGLIVLYRFLPQRSPYAEPEPQKATSARRAKKRRKTRRR